MKLLIKKNLRRIKNLPSRIKRELGIEIIRTGPRKPNHADIKRLADQASSGSALKLHFGCGPRVLKGWVNIDLHFEPFENYLQYYGDEHYPESVRGDRSDFYQLDFLQTGLPLPDNSVELIFHEDFFEHLTQKQQIIFLAETFRVMKKGAVQRINTPNLVASMRDNSNFSKGKEGVHTGEWDTWEHYSLMTPAIMEDMAKIVGYSDVKFNAKNQSIVADKLPAEYRPDARDRPAPDSNVFADLIK